MCLTHAELFLYSTSLDHHRISEMGPAIIPNGISISQMRLVRLREVKSHAQGCPAGRGQSLEPGLSLEDQGAEEELQPSSAQPSSCWQRDSEKHLFLSRGPWCSLLVGPQLRWCQPIPSPLGESVRHTMLLDDRKERTVLADDLSLLR